MVKYADGPRTDVEIEIDAPTSDVWPLLVDIELPARFSPELRTAEWIDDGPAEGATFRGYNQHPRVGEWDVLCTVTGFTSGSAFEWTVGDPANKTARWRFDLAPLGADRSALRFSAEMGPGPSGLTPMIARMPEREDDIVANRLADWNANMQLTVDGIAALAEGREPAS
ncbi:MAG: SRPBCC family protein [Actinomycetota bacterium]